MPTYVYECETDKSHSYEKIQKITENSDTVCPTCGGPVHRVITGGIGLIFNGKGFYQTDYKGANASLSGNSKKSESSEKCDNCESKPETKPASGGCGPNCGCHH